MEDYGRQKFTSEDRALQKEIEESTKVSSYLGNVYEAIHTGAAPKVNVPNYNPLAGQLGAPANETDGFSMDLGGLGDVNEMGIPLSSGNPEARPQAQQPQAQQTRTADTKPKFEISKNQYYAIKKYPTLIDFLGQPEGEKIAKRVSADLNIILAEVIEKNSKEASECALDCKSDKNNFRQYFKGDDWVCRVTASGPFHGDEVIYYSREKDVACVLRKHASGEQIKFEDISSDFNIIYEAENVVSDAPVEQIEEVIDEVPSVIEGEE